MARFAKFNYRAKDNSFIGEASVPVEEGETLEDVLARMWVMQAQYKIDKIPLLDMTIKVTLEG
jgi:hypothetical protein